MPDRFYRPKLVCSIQAGDPEHAIMAMESLNTSLSIMIQRSFNFCPPFDKSNMNPGYIKGYVPGVRENGGNIRTQQFGAMAFAKLGMNQHAWEIFGMINPINRANPSDINIYKVEPYVVAPTSMQCRRMLAAADGHVQWIQLLDVPADLRILFGTKIRDQ